MILECPNEMGSYDNKIFLKFPDFMIREYGGYYSSKNGCLVDICIAEEIKYLWNKGISTYGSCCGHSIASPMVNVDEKDFEKMEELGYSKLENNFNDCTFALKSVHQQKHKIEPITTGGDQMSHIHNASKNTLIIQQECGETWFINKMSDGIEIRCEFLTTDGHEAGTETFFNNDELDALIRFLVKK